MLTAVHGVMGPTRQMMFPYESQCFSTSAGDELHQPHVGVEASSPAAAWQPVPPRSHLYLPE